MEIEYATLYAKADECLIKFKCKKFQLLCEDLNKKTTKFNEKGLQLTGYQRFSIIDVYLVKFYSESDIEEHKDLQYFYSEGGTWVKKNKVKHLSIDCDSFMKFDCFYMFLIQSMTVSLSLSEYNLNSNKTFLEYIEKILSASSTKIPRLDIKIAMFFTPYKLSPADEKILWRIMDLPITHFDFNSQCPSEEDEF
jgi:hypothetical protein